METRHVVTVVSVVVTEKKIVVKLFSRLSDVVLLCCFVIVIIYFSLRIYATTVEQRGREKRECKKTKEKLLGRKIDSNSFSLPTRQTHKKNVNRSVWMHEREEH